MATEPGAGGLARRLTTETKQAFKTTEFWIFVIVTIGILVAANTIEGNDAKDYFTADRAWLYITILAAFYFLSRGIAKSGTRDPYWEQSGGSGLSDRMKTAATVLREGEPGQGGGEGPGGSRRVE